MRAVQTKLLSLAGYLAFVAGLFALCAHLSHHLGTQAVAAASPYLTFAKAEGKMTLVERRRAETPTVVADAAPVTTSVTGAPDSFVLDAPSIPAGVMAAQLDIAEGFHVSKEKPAVHRASKRRAERRAKVPAADVFGRSFGVMLMASR